MYILDHCLSPLTRLHLKICCCPSLNAVILLTVPFDKEFMLPISVTNTCVCWRNEKNKTNPVLFTSRKFIQCLNMLACRSAVPFLCINDNWILTANKYSHFSCDEASSLCHYLKHSKKCQGNANMIIFLNDNHWRIPVFILTNKTRKDYAWLFFLNYC